MARRTIAVQSTDVCGACSFCRPDPEQKDEFMCWVLPPQVFVFEDEWGWGRGAAVEVDSPKCHLYTPRRNS